MEGTYLQLPGGRRLELPDGNLLLLPGAPVVDDRSGVHVLVGGVEVEVAGWSVERETGMPATAALELQGLSLPRVLRSGAEVVIRDGGPSGRLFFGGHLDRPRLKVGAGGVVSASAQAIGWGRRLGERRLTQAEGVAVFGAADGAAQIAALLALLASEGFRGTVDVFAPSVRIDEDVRFERLGDVLDKLAEMNGATVDVTASREVIVRSTSRLAASAALDWLDVETVAFESSTTGARSSIIVRAGEILRREEHAGRADGRYRLGGVSNLHPAASVFDAMLAAPKLWEDSRERGGDGRGGAAEAILLETADAVDLPAAAVEGADRRVDRLSLEELGTLTAELLAALNMNLAGRSWADFHVTGLPSAGAVARLSGAGGPDNWHGPGNQRARDLWTGTQIVGTFQDQAISLRTVRMNHRQGTTGPGSIPPNDRVELIFTGGSLGGIVWLALMGAYPNLLPADTFGLIILIEATGQTFIGRQEATSGNGFATTLPGFRAALAAQTDQSVTIVLFLGPFQSASTGMRLEGVTLSAAARANYALFARAADGTEWGWRFSTLTGAGGDAAAPYRWGLGVLGFSSPAVLAGAIAKLRTGTSQLVIVDASNTRVDVPNRRLLASPGLVEIEIVELLEVTVGGSVVGLGGVGDEWRWVPAAQELRQISGAATPASLTVRVDCKGRFIETAAAGGRGQGGVEVREALPSPAAAGEWARRALMQAVVQEDVVVALRAGDRLGIDEGQGVTLSAALLDMLEIEGARTSDVWRVEKVSIGHSGGRIVRTLRIRRTGREGWGRRVMRGALRVD